ncbi:hypothetical protein BJY24_003992 [Nocardia transvalensis]|uniref:Uncharacterized protein n=1 Tax=Nocardia transvalensis TaxID=37333 RepID=A0A7W9PFI2_9NOCA|nr:hypothetical protein [Nocardia transvalensis]MBB5915125.1 hypothetical protein [Nocardia transvalensis]
MSVTVAWAAMAMLVMICGGAVYLLLRPDHEHKSDDGEVPTQTLWTERYTHEAPTYPLTVTGAHREMQRHRGCDREDCPRKAVAYRVLVEARHIKPDAGRTY